VLGRKRGKGASSAADRALERSPHARLEEAAGLAAAIDLDVVASGVVPVAEPKPATLFGSGKVEELKGLVRAEEASLVIVDHPLTPVQQRNLETQWGAKVLDRTGLILEIFGERARTREGRLQVELAHLVYQKSRLVRSWTHLERQRGGFGFLGGPGETQIEADRRVIGERIDNIRKELAHVRQTRALHRKSRQRVPYPAAALVGYTNAGKSTLFNALTGASVFAEDTLFATLDPTIRALPLPGGSKAVLSDTVGFISDLPTTLIAAFRATLEEVLEADLILHVRDIADETSASQRVDVNAVLRELGIDAESEPDRLLEVWNKADLLDDFALQSAENEARRAGAVLVSAVTRFGFDAFNAEIERRLNRKRETIEIALKPEEGSLSNWIYENCEVVGRKTVGEGITSLRIRIAPEKRERLARLAGPARLRLAAE
jgi:GTP-binding protein HflX